MFLSEMQSVYIYAEIYSESELLLYTNISNMQIFCEHHYFKLNPLPLSISNYLAI